MGILQRRILLGAGATAVLGGGGAGAAYLLNSPPLPSPVVSSVLASWTQYGASNNLIVRAIVSKANCPSIEVDGTETAMTLRTKTPPKGFEAVYVCEKVGIPLSTAAIRLEGKNLPVATLDPDTIVVIGDTGCRVKHSDIQNCLSDDTGSYGPKWNYAGIASAAAAENPDLIVHVGDMHYRETCSASECSTTPKIDRKNIGYTWESWKVDFFDPSASLFEKAPMILVRGNHEDCSRAYRGWFYFLDTGPLDEGIFGSPAAKPCPDIQPNYAVGFKDFQVVVMDTSAQSYYQQQFADLNATATGVTKPTMLATHVPLRALVHYGTNTSEPFKGQFPSGGLSDSISLTMSGHIHLFEALTFDSFPSQLVFGNSGTERDPKLPTGAARDRALQSIGADPSTFQFTRTFDYGVMTRVGADWKISVEGVSSSTGPLLEFTVPYDRRPPQ